MFSRTLSLTVLYTCLFSAILANNSDPLIVKADVNGYEITLQLANLEQVKAQVKLYSLENNKLIWSSAVNAHNGYSYHLELADLDYGRYYFEITKDETVKKQVVLIDENGISVSNIK